MSYKNVSKCRQFLLHVKGGLAIDYLLPIEFNPKCRTFLLTAYRIQTIIKIKKTNISEKTNIILEKYSPFSRLLHLLPTLKN
jgi:hypothetical protein